MKRIKIESAEAQAVWGAFNSVTDLIDAGFLEQGELKTCMYCGKPQLPTSNLCLECKSVVDKGGSP